MVALIANNLASQSSSLGQPQYNRSNILSQGSFSSRGAFLDSPSFTTYVTNYIPRKPRRSDISEGVQIINTVLGFLLGAVPSGSSATQLIFDAGALTANCLTQLSTGVAAASLNQCFADSVTAGITLDQMAGVVSEIAALNPISPLAVQLVQLCEILALTQEANIIVATTFTDRESVEATLKMIQDQFDPVIESTADTTSSDVLIALINLRSQIVQYLVDTEQPLPFLVEYVAGRSLPSFTLAMRLYADTTDVEDLANQLVSQNQVVNPAFMPAIGLALSAP